MTDLMTKLYWKLPVFIQEEALSIYARYLTLYYYGKMYEKWKCKVEKWRTWTREEAINWQNEQLRFIVNLAANHVPYYREKWKGINWRSVYSVDDLRLLPCLGKQDLRQHEQAFVVEGLRLRSLWLEKTSGTTGTSVRVYWSKAMLAKWWAVYEVMVRNSVGVGQEFPRAMMGGRPVVRGDTRRPPFWRYNRYWRQLYLSSYHLSPATAGGYIEAINRYGSQWITGYGSAIAALAQYALEGGFTPLHLRTAIVSGDTLLPGMRESIEKFFQCRCYDHYGQAEGVCMAFECVQGRMHVIPFVGIIEILRKDGTPCFPGEVGEIVATGLLNEAMPLIRYRLGDYAAWDEVQACSCGNPHPIIKNLIGRVDDYLITADGRKIGRLSTAVKRSPTIHSMQIVQDYPGHAFLLVRPGEGYRSVDARAVRDDILARIGAFRLDICEVDEIPKTPQGKTVLVVRLADRPSMRVFYEELLRTASFL